MFDQNNYFVYAKLKRSEAKNVTKKSLDSFPQDLKLGEWSSQDLKVGEVKFKKGGHMTMAVMLHRNNPLSLTFIEWPYHKYLPGSGILHLFTKFFWSENVSYYSLEIDGCL